MPLNQGLIQVPGAGAVGTNPTQLFGKQSDGIVSELHGKWYTAAYNGKAFFASTLIAGVLLPVNTTTAATFAVYNPLGSGVNMELISLDVTSLAAGVIAGLILGVNTQTPTSVTALVPLPTLIGGGGVPQGKAATAATIAAFTTGLFPVGQYTTATGSYAHYDFDGKMILAPGGLSSLFSNPVQTAISVPCMTWAEWPI